MTTTTKNYTTKQGETWRRVIRWEQSVFNYVAISAITQAAPASLTVTGHGLVSGWRGAISDVVGMTEINSSVEPPELPEDYHTFDVIDANTLEINALNSTGYGTYISGGVIRFKPPVDLTGFSARMSLRKKVKDAASLFDLTDGNGRIVLNNTTKTITLVIQDEETELLTFNSAVYDLELVDGSDEVSRLLSGRITLDKEVTR